MPHTRDFSDALFRRAKILTFNRKFEGDDRDPLLKQKLVEELPGILNMALKAVAGVLTTGKFAEPSSMVDAVGAWAIEADTVKQFVIECCELCHEVPMKTLYGTYQAWCRDVGINKPLKQRTFSNRLRLSGISDRKSGSVRYYVGISIA
jgi:phage/plasmid-associated DNA primase